MNELLIEETLSTVKIQPTKSKNILWIHWYFYYLVITFRSGVESGLCFSI